MSGVDKFREVGAKLKAETEAKKVEEEKSMTEAKSQLALLKEQGLSTQNDEEVSTFFNQEAQNDDDLGGTGLPVLRVHTNQSTNNKLLDGSEPEQGKFFYTGSKTAYSELIVRILKITQCELEEYGNSGEYKNHYLIAGVIANTNEPFVLYVKGVGYSEVWDLQAQLKPFVKRKQKPIPKYALFVRLFTELKQPLDKKYKPQYAIKYEVLGENGEPFVENRLSVLKWLKEMTVQATGSLEDIISRTGKQKPVNVTAEQVNQDQEDDQVEFIDMTDQGDMAKEDSIVPDNEEDGDKPPF